MATPSGLRTRKPTRCADGNLRGPRSARGRLCLLFILWAALCSAPGPAEALKVSMRPQKTAVLGTDVTLPCEISDYPPPELDIKKIIVLWYLETTEGSKIEQLYLLVAGKHSSSRSGSRLDTIQLKNGNATLFLPQIQVNEEGKYICSVSGTSDRAEGATILDLVAEPTIELSPKDLEIERGNVKTLTCAVNKFYPDSIVILWHKHSKHTADKSVLAEDIYMENSVRNGDGTYNTTSKLTLQPSLQDQGNVYSCTVKHKSFATYPVYNVTLTVTEPKSTALFITKLVLGCLGISILLIGCVLYIFLLKKHPPTLKVVGIKELKHLEKTELRCLISNFWPKPLHADLFLVIESQNTKQKIASWDTTSVEKPKEDHENIPLLGNLGEMFKVHPELKSKPNGFFDFHWQISVNPDIKKLPNFELSLEVKHKGFQYGLCVERKSFRVIALPVLHRINCSPNVPISNEPLTLRCKIHSYFPETLEVSWHNDDGCLDGSFSSPPRKGPDGLYFCISEIQYNPQVADSGKRFACRAKLEGSELYKESAWRMRTVALSPIVSKIECKPPVPECGKPITLSCLLTDYHPPECDIYWRKGFERLMDAKIKTEEPQLDRVSKLYSRTSEITFTPSAEDHDVEFFAEINHCMKILQEGYTVRLKDFPKLSNIVIEPSDAYYGETVYLYCDITDFHPKEICAQWFLGDISIKNGEVTEDFDMASNGCCKLTSMLELRATALACEKAICLKVSHEKLRKPITREVYVKLPAKRPVVSEIKATPDHKNILLEISISQFAPQDIQVRWYQGWRQISENINPRNIEIGEDHLCYFVSQIDLDPKAISFGKIIRCEVKHTTSSEERTLNLTEVHQETAAGMPRVMRAPLTESTSLGHTKVFTRSTALSNSAPITPTLDSLHLQSMK